jgi:inositol transport system substrate-binding protein
MVQHRGAYCMLLRKKGKSMKSAAAAALVATVSLIPVVMGCRPTQPKVKIGVTIAVFDDVWLTTLRDSMTAWASQRTDIELTVVDSKNDTNRQIGQVENFLAQGMDVVVILPVDTAATEPMTRSVLAAKKPLVYVNRKPDNLPDGVLYCGSRSAELGAVMMQELGRLMGGKGNVVILMGELSNEATINRTDGIKKVIREQYPDIKIVREQTANMQRDQGRTVMENWLASGERIDGVASNNDEMALGALMAIKAAGKLGEVFVGGVDASADALSSMSRDELNCTVFQDPKGQGEGAVEAAYLLAKRLPNPRVKDGAIWVPYKLVTKANYKSFMK